MLSIHYYIDDDVVKIGIDASDDKEENRKYLS